MGRFCQSTEGHATRFPATGTEATFVGDIRQVIWLLGHAASPSKQRPRKCEPRVDDQHSNFWPRGQFFSEAYPSGHESHAVASVKHHTACVAAAFAVVDLVAITNVEVLLGAETQSAC